MTTAAEPKPRRVRWLPGVILLALSPPFVLAAWYAAEAASDGDRTVQMIFGIAGLCIAVVVQAVWWLFLARLTWTGRIIGALCVAAVAGAAAGAVRIDGHTGEMLPIFAFRWEPTPEERAVAFFRDARPQPAPVSEPVAVSDGDWPEYRGPDRGGAMPDALIRTDWEQAPPKLVWGPQPIGPGWSSFAIVGDLLFTQEQRGEEELVVCYEAATGKQRWAHGDKARFSESLGGDGPRATPTFADGSVYSLGATGILNCLDAGTGTVRWHRDTLKDAGHGGPIPNIAWGMAGSPAVWKGKVYVAPGGGIDRGVIAYDAATGEPAWFCKGKPIWEKPAAAAGDEITMASYAAPRVETIGGETQLLVFDGEGLKSYDPATGGLLWSYGPWTNQPKVNAAMPIVQGERVFVSSGYTVGSALFEVKREGDRWAPHGIWHDPNEFKLKFNDAVLHDGHVYGLDEGILACYEFESGKRKWKSGRYGYGQVILLRDTLVILAEDGTLAAVKASPERFEELARIEVLEGKTWNNPAFARGFLYVRNDREAACLDLRP